ncbi:MAG TPA: BPTI/Kunitz domain-containing protein [Chryseosolibacter sp.]
MKSRIMLILAIVLLSCEYNSLPELVLDDRCILQPATGFCRASFQKYYYDQSEKKCKTFTWGGCGGVVPFNTLEECRVCEKGKSRSF